MTALQTLAKIAETNRQRQEDLETDTQALVEACGDECTALETLDQRLQELKSGFGIWVPRTLVGSGICLLASFFLCHHWVSAGLLFTAIYGGYKVFRECLADSEEENHLKEMLSLLESRRACGVEEDLEEQSEEGAPEQKRREDIHQMMTMELYDQKIHDEVELRRAFENYRRKYAD